VATGDAVLRDHVDPFVRKAATPIAGFGDAASFGLSYEIRELLGTNSFVNTCSWWYRGGNVVGFAVTAPFAEAQALRVGSKLYTAGSTSRLAPQLPRALDWFVTNVRGTSLKEVLIEATIHGAAHVRTWGPRAWGKYREIIVKAQRNPKMYGL
jgi:hypothetical protein